MIHHNESQCFIFLCSNIMNSWLKRLIKKIIKLLALINFSVSQLRDVLTIKFKWKIFLNKRLIV